MAATAVYPNPRMAVYCRHCAWRGVVREAVARVDELVRCPKCGQPVEQADLMTIWKYQLRGTSFQMPQGARILTLQLQDNVPTLWALVDPSQPNEVRTFEIKGTGFDFDPAGLTYVGTFQQSGFVWHLFEREQKRS